MARLPADSSQAEAAPGQDSQQPRASVDARLVEALRSGALGDSLANVLQSSPGPPLLLLNVLPPGQAAEQETDAESPHEAALRRMLATRMIETLRTGELLTVVNEIVNDRAARQAQLARSESV